MSSKFEELVIILFRHNVIQKWTIEYKVEGASCLTVPRQRYSGFEWTVNGNQLVVPGSTLKGVLSTHLERLLKTHDRMEVAGLLWGTPISRTSRENPCGLADWKGIVTVCDAVVTSKNNGEIQFQAHNGISNKVGMGEELPDNSEPFTDAHAVLPPPFTLTGKLELSITHNSEDEKNGLPESSVLCGLLCLSLEGLGNGAVHVGGFSSRGSGWFRNQSVIISVTDVKSLLVPNTQSSGDVESSISSKDVGQMMTDAREWLTSLSSNLPTVPDDQINLSEYGENRDWLMYELEITPCDSATFNKTPPPSLPDGTLNDGNGKIIIPGSMFKGMLRRQIINGEGLRELRNNLENNIRDSLDKYLFGEGGRQSYASRLMVSDFLHLEKPDKKNGSNLYSGRIFLRDSKSGVNQIVEEALNGLNNENGVNLISNNHPIRLVRLSRARFNPENAEWESLNN